MQKPTARSTTSLSLKIFSLLTPGSDHTGPLSADPGRQESKFCLGVGKGVQESYPSALRRPPYPSPHPQQLSWVPVSKSHLQGAQLLLGIVQGQNTQVLCPLGCSVWIELWLMGWHMEAPKIFLNSLVKVCLGMTPCLLSFSFSAALSGHGEFGPFPLVTTRRAKCLLASADCVSAGQHRSWG